MANAHDPQGVDVNSADEKKSLPPFWLDKDDNDQTALFNFYRFCELVEKFSGRKLGAGGKLSHDAVRFRPDPHLGFPTSELKKTETDPDHPDGPPTVRTTFLGLYGVDSPLPTVYVDDINQGREGADAMAAFLDIFNHRMMTQFYRIQRKYSYPTSYEEGGTDKFSRSLMALAGITQTDDLPTSRLLAILGPMMHTTLTAEGVVAVIRSQALSTRVEVFPHHPVTMPVNKRTHLSLKNPMVLSDRLILGDEVETLNYCMRIEMYTEDAKEAKDWWPQGQLRKDVFALLKAYLGCDYDVVMYLTVPVRILPRPKLGDPGLFIGYNIMSGLGDDNENEMPQTIRTKVGKLRGKDFEEG
ncbi:TPA: type VI secretion system baseplate subunit TssG [Klebsiella aerogenes]|nr:type VI secretion system baseplate subunit TssG [Klebsiella aerogenes]